MLLHAQKIGMNPIYHIGNPIEANQIPIDIDNIDNVYTINGGKPNRAVKYVNGPIKTVVKNTNDAINAKLIIDFLYNIFVFYCCSKIL